MRGLERRKNKPYGDGDGGNKLFDNKSVLVSAGDSEVVPVSCEKPGLDH